MSINRGKQFEDVIKQGIEDTGVYVLRLYDPQGGYVAVANPCDFIAYNRGKMFMLECKAVHGNLLSIHSNDPKRKYGNISNKQWDGMLEASQKGVIAGVIVWYIDRDVTVFIPIEFLKEQRGMGRKSVQYGLVSQCDFEGDKIQPIVIGGNKKRVFFDYDFRNFFEKF